MLRRAGMTLLILFIVGQSQSSAQNTSQTDLKKLTLEELMNIQVTTPTKEPEDISSTPAAIYVITSEEIRRGSFVRLATEGTSARGRNRNFKLTHYPPGV